MTHCVYYGEESGNGKHDCQLFDKCVQSGGGGEIASCDNCKDQLSLEDKDFPSKWKDPLLVTDRWKHKTDALQNLLAGASVFLIGGGPSANDLPLEELNRRGVWSMAVNNAAGHARYRPQAMVCSDPPKKFSSSIWLDPCIMKFTAITKLGGTRARLRRKLEDSTFERMEKRVYDCPNVWGFKRSAWLAPDDSFFLSDGAHWGNHNSGVEKTGQPKTVCTMLLGLRLLRYLGARRIFLVGCDFRMAPDYGYSFLQGRTEEACQSNNAQFRIVNKWLCQLEELGIFRKFGLSIYNCFQMSSLQAFSHVPFEDALADCKGVVEDKIDLTSWYEKGKDKK